MRRVPTLRWSQPVSEPSIPLYEIEFYEDDQGREPALAFMRSLTGPKRRAIGVAINEFLRYLGPDVVRTDFVTAA
jgi:hypothetical protein